MMKKMVDSFLAVSLIVFSLFVQAPKAEALGAVWVKDYTKDKYGDPTEEYYLVNKNLFKGTYNSDTINNGKIGASLIFKLEGERLFTYISLYFNMKNTEQVKNSSRYEVSVKLADGNELSMSGVMDMGSIILQDTFTLAETLSSSKSDISFYIQEIGNDSNNYLFKAKSGNFEKLFSQEILMPYQESQYLKAEQLLQIKQFDLAASIFSEIAEYKDSAARIEETYEARNADAYAFAERLLESEEYDEAVKVFRDLGDYRDSALRADEVLEAKNADLYTKAEQLLTSKKYDEAAKAFRELGTYRDSSARVTEAYEAKNADAYAKAEQLLASKKYDEAAKAFRELGTYRDSASRIAEVYETKNSELYEQAETLFENKQFYNAAELFGTLGDYRDSSNRSNESYIKQYGEDAFEHFNQIDIGDSYLFGSYKQNYAEDGWSVGDSEDIEWIVLDKRSDENGLSLLLISKKALAGENFHLYFENKKKETPTISWGSCTLRKWLNEEFMITAFNNEERSRILKTEITNHDSEKPTRDRVFLLSEEEVRFYFPSNKDRLCPTTSVANGHRGDSVYENWSYFSCMWWTRTPRYKSDVVIVAFDGSFDSSDARNPHIGVRPALWISLTE